MTIFPIRNTAKYGIITDVDSYDLPPEAWSGGVNARFRADKITRAPVFRNPGVLLSQTTPRFIQGFTPVQGQDTIFNGYLNGSVYLFNGSSETLYNPPGYSPTSSESTWSACHLGGVAYINRSDRSPWYLQASGSQFLDLSTANPPVATGYVNSPWSSQWQANILRAFNGALVALNVTKSGTNFPTMVKTSSFAQSGQPPNSWDQTVPASSASENILAEIEGGILDGLRLGNVFFIYGLNETWGMQASGDTFIYDYAQVFTNRGILNTNCVIEVNRQHIVFGVDDIWAHDGVNQRSLCDGRTREFIYSGLNVSKANRCFIVHNAILKEIMFCYVSGDQYVQFLGGTDGCNRSATWNYQDDTWTFDDLPLVYSGTRANISTVLTWSSAPAGLMWANIGGSWKDQEDSEQKNTLFIGADYTGGTTQQVTQAGTAVLTRSVYAFDATGPLSNVSWAVDLNATQPMYLIRNGIDLDAIGANLKGYKLCSSIYPQGRLDTNAAPVQYTIGAADNFNDAPTYANTQTWDGVNFYKLDFNIAGRFLAMTIFFPDYHFVSLSGYDAELQVLGQR